MYDRSANRCRKTYHLAGFVDFLLLILYSWNQSCKVLCTIFSIVKLHHVPKIRMKLFITGELVDNVMTGVILALCQSAACERQLQQLCSAGYLTTFINQYNGDSVTFWDAILLLFSACVWIINNRGRDLICSYYFRKNKVTMCSWWEKDPVKGQALSKI